MSQTQFKFAKLLTLLFITLTTTTVWAITYIVKQGDSLSHSIGLRIPGPVWGKSGSLRRILAINPQIKNPNRIFPGDQVSLGANPLAESKNSKILAIRSLATEPAQADPIQPEQTQVTQAVTPDPNKPESLLAAMPQPRPSAAIESPIAELKNEVSLPAVRELGLSGSTREKSEKTPNALQQNLVPEEIYHRYTYFVVSPGTFFTRLDGKDKTTGGSAALLSDLNYSLNFNWFFVWSEKFRPFVRLGVTSMNILPSQSGASIAAGNQIDSQLGAGVESDPSSRLTLGAGLLMTQEIFYNTKTQSSINLDRLALSEALAYSSIIGFRSFL